MNIMIIDDLFTLARLHPALAQIALLHADIARNESLKRQIRKAHENKVVTNESICYYLHETLHREDGPAEIYHRGNGKDDLSWYLYGLYHREDGPAVIGKDEYDRSRRKWYIHGMLHREDAPAIEFKDGSWKWYKDGVKHREDDSPAVYVKDRDEHRYYINGQLHRLTGPAIDVSEDNYVWYKDGVKHREDGPAMYYKSEDEFEVGYYVNGALHREDGPAHIHRNEFDDCVIYEWWLNGEPGRTKLKLWRGQNETTYDSDYESDQDDYYCESYY